MVIYLITQFFSITDYRLFLCYLHLNNQNILLSPHPVLPDVSVTPGISTRYVTISLQQKYNYKSEEIPRLFQNITAGRAHHSMTCLVTAKNTNIHFQCSCQEFLRCVMMDKNNN